MTNDSPPTSSKPSTTHKVSSASAISGVDGTPIALLQTAALRQLIRAGTTQRICAVGVHGGFIVEIGFPNGKAQLATSRGNVRVFASLLAVANLLKDLGLSRFEADVADFQPGRIRPAQPQRSAAMRSGRLPKGPLRPPDPSDEER